MYESMERIFVVERYLPLTNSSQATDIAARLEEAERVLSRRRRDVSWLCSVVLPRDEAWVCFFAASDAGDVLELNRIAGLTCDALLEARLIRPKGSDATWRRHASDVE